MTSIFARPPRTRQILATQGVATDFRDIKSMSDLLNAITAQMVVRSDPITGVKPTGVVARLVRSIFTDQTIQFPAEAEGFVLIGSPRSHIVVTNELGTLLEVAANRLQFLGVVAANAALGSFSNFIAQIPGAGDEVVVSRCDAAAGGGFVQTNGGGGWEITGNRTRGNEINTTVGTGGNVISGNFGTNAGALILAAASDAVGLNV